MSWYAQYPSCYSRFYGNAFSDGDMYAIEEVEARLFIDANLRLQAHGDDYDRFYAYGGIFI